MKQETEEWRAAEKKQYEKMTETPVSKLIIMLGIPTTISMLGLRQRQDAVFH